MSPRRPAPPDRAARLASRRETLVALSRVQRELIALRWRAAEPSLRWADRGWQAGHWVRRHPAEVLVSVAALTALTHVKAGWTGRLLAGALAAARVGRWWRRRSWRRER